MRSAGPSSPAQPVNDPELATSTNFSSHETPILSTPPEAMLANTSSYITTSPKSVHSSLTSMGRLSPSSSKIPGNSPGSLGSPSMKPGTPSPLHTLARRFKPPVWHGPQCELHPLTPSDLSQELSKQPQSVLIIDIRPYTMFQLTRVKSAISICIPSTLLKRQTFGFRRIVDFVAPQDVETLQRVNECTHIVFYDQRTSHCGIDSSLRRTAAKFLDADPSLAPKLYWLVGGIVAVARDMPDLLEVDESNVVSPNSGTADANENTEETPKLTISSIRAAPRSPFSLLPVVTAVGATLRSPLNTPSRQPPLDDSSSLHVEGEIASRLPEFPQWLIRAVKSTERGQNVLAEAFQRLQAAEINRIASASGSSRQNDRRIELNAGNFLSPNMRTGTPWSTPSTPYSDRSALSTSSSISTSPMDLKHEYAQRQRIQQQNQFHGRGTTSHSVTQNQNSSNETLQAVPHSVPLSEPTNSKPASASKSPMPDPSAVHFSIVAGDDPRKNRYTNIAPFDYNRVLVRGSEYLNASYIRSSLSRLQYIATQAPVPAAFGDFWWCVFEHKVPLIIMLTALRTESGQIKGNKYWFNSSYDGLEVRLVEEHSENINGTVSGLYVRHIELRYNDIVHEVVHFQYENWPDLGCPADPSDVLELVEQKKRLVQGSKEESFVVVHCSAGCGRTGTFCAIDTVTDFLSKLTKQEARQDPDDRVLSVVSEFREQRMAMVQNQRQLLLCYEAVMIWYLKQLENEN